MDGRVSGLAFVFECRHTPHSCYAQNVFARPQTTPNLSSIPAPTHPHAPTHMYSADEPRVGALACVSIHQALG